MERGVAVEALGGAPGSVRDRARPFWVLGVGVERSCL